MFPIPAIDQSVDTVEDAPVTATVDLAAVRHNVQAVQDRAGAADLMAIVKADAYGHGVLPVAQVLHDEGVRHFGVARPAEGIRLREAGHAARILVLGAPSPEQISQYAEYDLALTIPSADVAAAVVRHARPNAPLRVHVKVDTGMGRLGLSPEDVPAVLSHLAETPGVTLAGIWTHFATADAPGSTFAQTQLERFQAVVEALDVPVEHVHAANTGALLTLGAPTQHVSSPLVRSGIALYGLAATPDLSARLNLRPAMQLTARVTHLKTVPAGTPISYGAHWQAPRRTRIATLGVGYGDGYPRLCSGRASVRLGGTSRPIVGTICMDMCMVDLGPPSQPPATTVELGDEAVLFGPSGPTVYDVAQWSETIPYEICCSVSPRVPRRYVTPDDDSDSDPHPRSALALSI
ncbi:MAG: alanine racemase [Bacteroidetes bacterium QH_6_63_17]|nr:MAG: alanine racemase [Bacteroidetes bacterium QH_6_63_17]